MGTRNCFSSVAPITRFPRIPRPRNMIEPTDQWRIGSLTKPFTASVVLQLVGEHKVELDAPIARYLPGVVTGKYDGNKITVRNLLQHTSGLIGMWEMDGTAIIATQAYNVGPSWHPVA